jgi:hypothetical protein
MTDTTPANRLSSAAMILYAFEQNGKK